MISALYKSAEEKIQLLSRWVAAFENEAKRHHHERHLSQHFRLAGELKGISDMIKLLQSPHSGHYLDFIRGLIYNCQTENRKYLEDLIKTAKMKEPKRSP